MFFHWSPILKKKNEMKIKNAFFFFSHEIEHLYNRLDDKFFHQHVLHLSNTILLDYHQRNFQMDHDRHNNAKKNKILNSFNEKTN
jgi:hypothetical protein